MAKRNTKLTAEQQEHYRLEVQRINKQLYRLEKHYAETGENIYATAYVGAMRDIKAFFGDQKRYSKTIPETVREYQKIINSIKRFYSKPSATLSGMANVYGKRAKTWSKKMKANITADDMRDIFESGLYKAFADVYGSATVLRAIGMVERQAGRIEELLREGKKVYFIGKGVKDLNDLLGEVKDLDAVLRRYYEGAAQ